MKLNFKDIITQIIAGLVLLIITNGSWWLWTYYKDKALNLWLKQYSAGVAIKQENQQYRNQQLHDLLKHFNIPDHITNQFDLQK